MVFLHVMSNGKCCITGLRGEKRMSMMDKMMGFMMERMSKEEKEEMMDRMMDPVRGHQSKW